jgi:hypothetical protein
MTLTTGFENHDFSTSQATWATFPPLYGLTMPMLDAPPAPTHNV